MDVESTATVLPFSKLKKRFLGYFLPEKFISDNANKWFSGWTNQYFSENKTTAQQTQCLSQQSKGPRHHFVLADTLRLFHPDNCLCNLCKNKRLLIESILKPFKLSLKTKSFVLDPAIKKWAYSQDDEQARRWIFGFAEIITACIMHSILSVSISIRTQVVVFTVQIRIVSMCILTRFSNRCNLRIKCLINQIRNISRERSSEMTRIQYLEFEKSLQMWPASSEQLKARWNGTYMTVLPLLPKYRSGHPEN